MERLRIPVLEERLDVRARPVEIGRARVRKDVEERVERHPVRLRRQEVRVERVPIDREVAGVVEPFMDGDVYVVPVLEEQVVIQRRLVVREEIRVRRVLSEREETLEVPLRGERVTVEEDLPLEGAAGGEAGSEPT
ncbi:MAG: YsnF/AvaK domain-containing protein [Thermomicrobiaceae bacterium]|nr:YsnF/AvaK domain-containing protein [Thermomicrobiaceae bacterium]